MKRWIPLIAACLIAGGLSAAETKPWTNKAQLSYLSANGNTKSTTIGASNLFTLVKGHWAFELPAGALNTSTRGTRTAGCCAWCTGT